MPMRSSPSPKDQTRLWPLDALRGLATVGMVETHVCNVGRMVSQTQTRGAHAVDFANGLVAPLFFVVTGFALAWRPPETQGQVLRRCRAALGWWMVAFLLHLPQVGSPGGVDCTPLRQFDVLHSLALAAFALTFLQWRVPPARQALACAALAGVVLWLTVAVDRGCLWAGLPLYLQGWFAHNAASRFPLLPWSAFLFFGASLPALSRGAAHPRRWAGLLMATGTIAWLATGTAWGRTLTFDARANPFFLVTRAAAVGAPVLLAPASASVPPGSAARGCAWLGRRSLALYAVHLFLLFSTLVPGGPLADRFAGTLTPLGVTLWAAGLLAASAALVWVGRRGMGRLAGRSSRGGRGTSPARDSLENPLGEPPS